LNTAKAHARQRHTVCPARINFLWNNDEDFMKIASHKRV